MGEFKAKNVQSRLCLYTMHLGAMCDCVRLYANAIHNPLSLLYYPTVLHLFSLYFPLRITVL